MRCIKFAEIPYSFLLGSYRYKKDTDPFCLCKFSYPKLIACKWDQNEWAPRDIRGSITLNS